MLNNNKNKLIKHREKPTALFLKALAFTALITASNASFAVKKCQDADGRWHYGDIAVIECENSKITTLDDRGFIEDELARPKTEEELVEEAQAEIDAAKEADRLREIEENKQRILSIYETEADIDRHRDNQLDSVDGNIAVHKAFLKSQEDRIKRAEQKREVTKHLKAKQRIAEDIEVTKDRIQTYQSALEKLLVQKEQIVERFSREKALYQRLKNESS